ncbi:hypothetical protein DFH27DRAFT_520628 [Peziza echinospora]|nr:hypothetical protein DFH27DRAFT_520628 [Peziza echinospora]
MPLFLDACPARKLQPSVDCLTFSDTINADADIAGLGVVLSFLIPTLIGLVVSFILLINDRYSSKGLDSATSDFLEGIVLSFSDTQMVTGFALLIAGYMQKCSVTVYHYLVINRLVGCAVVSHIIMVAVLRSHFGKDNWWAKALTVLRIGALMSLTIIWLVWSSKAIYMGRSEYPFRAGCYFYKSPEEFQNATVAGIEYLQSEEYKDSQQYVEALLALARSSIKTTVFLGTGNGTLPSNSTQPRNSTIPVNSSTDQRSVSPDAFSATPNSLIRDFQSLTAMIFVTIHAAWTIFQFIRKKACWGEPTTEKPRGCVPPRSWLRWFSMAFADWVIPLAIIVFFTQQVLRDLQNIRVKPTGTIGEISKGHNLFLTDNSQYDWGFGQIVPMVLMTVMVIGSIDSLAQNMEKKAKEALQ